MDLDVEELKAKLAVKNAEKDAELEKFKDNMNYLIENNLAHQFISWTEAQAFKKGVLVGVIGALIVATLIAIVAGL